MNSNYNNQMNIVIATRAAFLSAKENLLAMNDITSDEATQLIDNLIATRNAFIEQSIAFAELSPKCTTVEREALRGLALRAAKSPAIRERLLNMLLAIELK